MATTRWYRLEDTPLPFWDKILVVRYTKQPTYHVGARPVHEQDGLSLTLLFPPPTPIRRAFFYPGISYLYLLFPLEHGIYPLRLEFPHEPAKQISLIFYPADAARTAKPSAVPSSPPSPPGPSSTLGSRLLSVSPQSETSPASHVLTSRLHPSPTKGKRKRSASPAFKSSTGDTPQ